MTRVFQPIFITDDSAGWADYKWKHTLEEKVTKVFIKHLLQVIVNTSLSLWFKQAQGTSTIKRPYMRE